VGVVNVHAHESGHFAPDVVQRLTGVADLLAGIVEGAVLGDRLRHREEQLERFAEHTIELQELERRRIAGDIHDGISQRLVSGWYHLRAARAAARDQAVLEELAAVETLLSEALDEARGAIRGLRPTVLDDLGLAAALESLAAAAGAFEVELDLHACSIAPHLETCVYRVAQEALQNAVKHSGAHLVHMSLACEGDHVVLSVRDDGRGFDPAVGRRSDSYGVAGMVERAALVGGKLELESSLGMGTRVTVSIPVNARSLDSGWPHPAEPADG